VLLILLFLRPSSGILSIVGFCSSVLFARYIGLKKSDLLNGLYTYNSVLIGIGIGFLFSISPLSIILTIIAAIFTVLLSYGLYQVFSFYFGIPILNLPFTIIIIALYLASTRYGNLFIAKDLLVSNVNLDFLPFWISGLLKATGIIIFLPYDIVGLAMLIAIFVYSRINFFLTIFGYYAGAMFLWLLKGSAYYAFTDVYGFNFILIALSIGGLYMIPSIKSYAIAFISVLASVFILDAVNVFWSSYSIPVFTIPFIFTVLPVLYVMRISNSPFITKTFIGNPENNMEVFLSYSSRFDLTLPQPHLPFSGEWKVYQGFNDEWTHKGDWCYGIDFVIENKTDNLTYRNEGLQIDDYYCFNKPVLSPVSGVVIECFDELKDNPIGTVDSKNNWGNYVIIQGYWNYYVEISHFAEKSILVKPGERVSVGQCLGKCGNSGYSPQPHIHFQVQNLPRLGSPSVPFRFIDTLCDGVYIGSRTIPAKNQIVKPFIVSRTISHKLQFLLGETFTFDYMKNDIYIKTITFRVKMDENAAYYMSDVMDTNDTTKLYFSVTDGIFSFYQFTGNTNSPLKYLMVALPRMPLTEEYINWSDRLSSLLFTSNHSMYSFLKSFNHRLFSSEGVYGYNENDEIAGTIKLNLLFRFKKIKTTLTFNAIKMFEKVDITIDSEKRSLIRKEG
jgi:urea transporter